MSLLKKKYTWIIATIVLAIGYVVSCTKDNQVLDVPPENAGTDLISIKVSTPPTIDGVIDASWNNAAKLNVTPTVPDPGNGLFTGYNGEQYPASVRSMYDDQNIYFLVEWSDAKKSSNVSPWYFDPATSRWAQEPSSRTFNVNGTLIREGWGEDKLAMLWNIDFSTPKFITQTCYASCHVFTPYMDYSKTPPVYASNAGSGNHYTNGASEKIDMWWGRLGYISKDPTLHFMDDNYQDWAGGPAITNLTGGNANGRHVDGIYPTGTDAVWPNRPLYSVSPAQGEINNRISLKLDGTGASVNVPMYVSDKASGSGFIMASDTATAKRVVAVSSTGVLTFSDDSMLDPTATTDYNRSGDPVYGGVGPKSIPGFIAAPLLGGRADITCAAVYTGSGWIVEIKRKLKTDDTLKQDIDFSSLDDQQFGMAIWNGSNNQHGIQPNLILKFKK